MALVLKPDKTYEDRYGNAYTDVYLVVDETRGHKKAKTQTIHVDIYKDKPARQAKKLPIHRGERECREDEFNEFFKPTVLNSSNAYKQSYKWLAIEKDYEGNLVWGDWQSDE